MERRTERTAHVCEENNTGRLIDYESGRWWVKMHQGEWGIYIYYCPYCGEKLEAPETDLEQAFGHFFASAGSDTRPEFDAKVYAEYEAKALEACQATVAWLEQLARERKPAPRDEKVEISRDDLLAWADQAQCVVNCATEHDAIYRAVLLTMAIRRALND